MVNAFFLFPVFVIGSILPQFWLNHLAQHQQEGKGSEPCPSLHLPKRAKKDRRENGYIERAGNGKKNAAD